MRSTRLGRAVGIAFVVGALTSGCGSTVATTQEQSVATPPEPANYAGLAVTSLAQAGFSIGVPTGWTTMTGEDADRATLDAAVEGDPTLRAQRDLLTQDDTPLKLIAHHYDVETCTCSTISVMAFPRGDNWDDETFADEGGFRDGARKLAVPGTTPTSQRVKTPVASGVRVRVRTTLPGSSVQVIMTQYYLHTRKSVYIVTYTASPKMTATYDRLFVRSVRSLREV